MAFDNLFGDLFGGLFPSSKQETAPVEGQVFIDLETRMRDLEIAVAQGGLALERIKDRVGRVKASRDQEEQFLLAFRTDLEITKIHNLLDTDKMEEKWSGKRHIQGHASMTAAMEGYEFAQAGLWEWARVKFQLAVSHSADHHWTRSANACEQISKDLRREPPVKPMDPAAIKATYEKLEIGSPEISEALRAGSRAQTPLEFLEAWHKLGKHSLAFANIISDDVLEKAREGKWEELLTFEKEMHKDDVKTGGYLGSGTPRKILEVIPIEGWPQKVTLRAVVLPSYSLSEDAPATPLGKHLATITDPDATVNKARVWGHVFWGAGFFPHLRGGAYGQWGAREREDGLWYIETYRIQQKYDPETGQHSKERVWGKQNEDLAEGYPSREEALRVAWKHKIYKE